MSRKGQETFKAFHKRNVTPVYPFDEQEDSEFLVDIGLPDLVLLGRAVRTCYTSDKWNSVGDVVGYYHDHGPDDGDHALKESNKTQFFAPKEIFPEEPVVRLSVKWPSELVLLGECDEWYVQQELGDKEFIHGKCKGDVLLCSPHGWLSSSDPTRAFLVILETDSGHVEAVIVGPDLRVTAAGIEG